LVDLQLRLVQEQPTLRSNCKRKTLQEETGGYLVTVQCYLSVCVHLHIPAFKG